MSLTWLWLRSLMGNVEQFSKLPIRVMTLCPITPQIYHKISFPTNIELSSQCTFTCFLLNLTNHWIKPLLIFRHQDGYFGIRIGNHSLPSSWIYLWISELLITNKNFSSFKSLHQHHGSCQLEWISIRFTVFLTSVSNKLLGNSRYISKVKINLKDYTE